MKNKSEVILSEIINSFNDCFDKLQKKPVNISVALSGGVDSIVLLHSLNRLKTKLKLKFLVLISLKIDTLPKQLLT